jgi:2-dehydro-3-deoxyphosphogalactonate aldolase
LFNAQIAPHIYCGPIAHAAATHLGFTLPNFLILETILSDFHNSVVRKPLDWDAGWMVPPTGPGLGVELNHDVVLGHPYTTGGRLHLEMTQTPLDSNNSRLARELD